MAVCTEYTSRNVCVGDRVPSLIHVENSSDLKQSKLKYGGGVFPVTIACRMNPYFEWSLRQYSGLSFKKIPREITVAGIK